MDESTIDESFTEISKPYKKSYTQRRIMHREIYDPNFFQKLKNSNLNNLNFIQAPQYIPKTITPKPEIKTVDVPLTSSNFRLFATPPIPILLNGSQTGAGFWNRIGSKIRMKSIQMKGSIVQALTSVEGYLRMVVVYDKQANGAFPTLSTVFETRDNAGAQTNTVYSMMKTESRDRFEILKDETWRSPSATYTAGVQTNGPSFPGVDNEFEFNCFVKLKNRKATYNASTGAIGDITTGSLFVYFIAAGTDNAWTCNWTSRLRFYDN